MSIEEPARFRDLLLAYSQADDLDARRDIDRRLWDEYGAEAAVFVLDMSGFSRLAHKYGVVHYLSMVRRMQLTAEPVIAGHGGRVVRFEADNCFATFPEPGPAIQAAIALNLAFDAANLVTPDDLDIHIAIGIDFGRILLVGETDFFGNAVNRASKLGEDLAGAGEVLVTADAMARVPEVLGVRGEAVSLSVSGIDIAAFSVAFRGGEAG